MERPPEHLRHRRPRQSQLTLETNPDATIPIARAGTRFLPTVLLRVRERPIVPIDVDPSGRRICVFLFHAPAVAIIVTNDSGRRSRSHESDSAHGTQECQSRLFHEAFSSTFSS